MIAVLGSTGQLGTAVIERLGNRARPVPRSELDLAETGSIGPWVRSNNPRAIINCAAYTAVDAAESNEETAYLINAVATEELATVAREREIRLITFSTDYVFDGNKKEAYVESDRPNPLSVYGRSKFEGEKLVMARYPEALVIRTSWVLSGTHPNFASTMLGLLRKGSVNVVDDQRGKPTLVRDLALPVVDLVESEIGGVLHITNEGETTWFQLARAIADLGGLDPDRVQPIDTKDFPRPARRPKNSVLDSERLDESHISRLPHHLDSLEDVVQSLLQLGF